MCKISICIPCYEMNGSGVRYLHDLMQSILMQSFMDFEIIITDHSQNTDIENYLRQNYTGKGYKIKYFRHNYKRGVSSANINMAMKSAKGKIIKPMFQDDIFYDTRCLEKINYAYEHKNAKWGGVGFNHISSNNQIYIGTKHKPQIPELHPNLLVGENTFGCPSIMFFVNDENLFDEELIWLMDCEFLYRLIQKYGDPSIIEEYLVSVRIWDKSVSSQVRENREITDKEKEYVLNKYPNFVETKEEKEDE